MTKVKERLHGLESLAAEVTATEAGGVFSGHGQGRCEPGGRPESHYVSIAQLLRAQGESWKITRQMGDVGAWRFLEIRNNKQTYILIT